MLFAAANVTLPCPSCGMGVNAETKPTGWVQTQLLPLICATVSASGICTKTVMKTAMRTTVSEIRLGNILSELTDDNGLL